jgi:Fic family protein
LKSLREHAVVESTVSSNRIEGVEVEHSRVGTVVFGQSALRDRDEEEVRGYRRALQLVHEQTSDLRCDEATIKRLHQLARGQIWDAGQYKERDGDIIERYPDGRERVRFTTLSATDTPAAMATLVELWHRLLRVHRVQPLVALAACNLDFLCIHPFRDGNGRVSRLLLLLQCYQLGFEVGRYISLERLIEQHKDRYYETLEQSSQGWHQGQHDPWHYINFLLSILRDASREFETRVGQTSNPRGTKTEAVQQAIAHLDHPFTITEIEQRCPGVSRDMIRFVLKNMRNNNLLECIGRGPQARWHKR